MKHTNYFSNASRAFTLLTIAGASLFFASCDKEDEDPAPTMTVMEIIEETAGLDSLEKYLNTYPDLVALFEGSAEYTVFAPNNTAFAGLLATPGFPSDIRDINPDIVKGVLTYHAVSGTKLAADLTSGSSLASAQGENIGVTVTAGVVTLQTGSSNANIDVLEADLKATNGVVHIVESVMIPPTVGASLTPILGTAAGTVLLGAPFSYLATLIIKADAGKPVNETITGLLANKTTGYEVTIFAPANAVFEGAAAAASISVEAYLNALDAETANTLIRNHIVVGDSYTSTTMTNGQQLTTVLPQTLTVSLGTVNPNTNPHGITIISQGFNPDAPTAGGAAPIFEKDIAVTNGVVHAVGGILKPGA